MLRSNGFVHSRTTILLLKFNKGRWTPLVTQLDLYIDSNYLIRCGGRLLNADIPNAARNPVLLPKTSELTRLIISYYHEGSLHSGVNDPIFFIFDNGSGS